MNILPHWLSFFSSSHFETYWLFLNFSLHKLLPFWLNALIYSPYNVYTLLLPVIYGICGLPLFSSIKLLWTKILWKKVYSHITKEVSMHSSASWKYTHIFAGIVRNGIFKTCLLTFTTVLQCYWNFCLYWKPANPDPLQCY